MTINIQDLLQVDTISTADRFLVYSNDNGSNRTATFDDLLTFFNQNAVNGYEKVYSNAGVNIDIGDTSSNVWLILAPPIATIASLSIKLPLYSQMVDGQEIILSSNKTVTSLTWNLNGANTNSNGWLPSTITPYQTYRLRFDKVENTYYTI